MSYTFPTQPIVAPAKKKDARKDAADAAERHCSPLPSREHGRAAVAVDGDRGSQYALKWAADNILSRARPFFLVHVRRKPTFLQGPGGKQFAISHVQDDIPADLHAQMDLQAKDLMIPFQCFCSRRGLQCREIILDGTDVSKAIVDFVATNKVDKLVLGSASRNAFTRTIWKLDVPTSVTKSAPSFCSVYVIAKGKISSFRPATYANETSGSRGDPEPDHPPGNSLPDEDEAELSLFRIERKQQQQQDGDTDTLPWNYHAEGLSEQREMGRTPESSHRNRPEAAAAAEAEAEAEACSQSAIGPKHKPSSLDTLPHQRGEEFADYDSQDIIHPILRRWPPICSPRDDSRGGSSSATPEEARKLDLKLRALPRPIETKRMLECLPTRLECRIFTADDIANATNHFADELKIGEGGYGPVYKATLDDTLVAVKILYSNVTQGLKQFRQEVELLNNIRHPNMVRLVGACPVYGCLVYEYMPNGSLEDRLFCRGGTAPLPWRLRFRVAVEIASGLLYLHKMRPEAFVHRDLKPGNILLDAAFAAKIGDVGLARIIPRAVDVDGAATQYRETAAAGTFCYIDPEYQKTGLLCTKSDVYALGVILLQMVTAREPMGLAYAVSDALEEGTFPDLLDGNVAGWPVPEAQAFAELALKCCEMRRRDRPDLETVVMPELVRLHRVVSPSEYPSSSSSLPHSMDQAHHRSASNKDLRLDNDLVDILSEGRLKGGASFAM
ncbi:Protein kinase protein with adenine nucleotide alpha hydrolase-like domain [Zea mays]|uniref:RING-type E3 ubiquitin transferase n=1 Tax=Zea mays TaxID=4577 RepID=A0A1D6QT33_MAIZE|nr:Protein kinase protein with adenine nucleotide alpha hydrolase-like domain [Zea mays]